MKNYRRILILLLILDICIILAGIAKYHNKSYEVAAQTSYVSGGETSCEEKWVVPSGEPIGIYVKSEGVMVIGIGEVNAKDGKKYSPCENLISAGDYILSIEGEMIDDKAELTNVVNESSGDELEITVQKKQDLSSDSVIIDTIKVVPVESKDGNYMLGLWVKDDISGIGTLTYYDEKRFGALGHSINDNDTGDIFEISDGAIYKANLINIVKPNRKIPGRLEGMIDYSSSNMIGRVEANSSFGVKGYITNGGREVLSYDEYMPIGRKEQLNLGEAYILSAVSGQREYYSVEIVNILYDSSHENKEIELRITDSRLIELTNGIVQGMSGSPIIQDGKIVGAVTHVLVNDPTRGYGIFIENMLEH